MNALAKEYVIEKEHIQYPIVVDDIETHEDLLHWVWHLGQKTWITPAIIRKFVQDICKIKGWNVPKNETPTCLRIKGQCSYD